MINTILHKNNAVFNNYPDLLTIEQMQKAMGIGRTTAYQLIADGKIRHMRIGKSIKIPKLFIIDFISQSCYSDYISNGQLVLSREGAKKKW